MPGQAPPPGVSNFYIYQPAHGASIAFAILFMISGTGHIWQNNLKYRSYRIGFLLPWAAFLFTAGFILREYGSYNTNNLGVFIASQVLLFIAPPVYNGAVSDSMPLQVARPSGPVMPNKSIVAYMTAELFHLRPSSLLPALPILDPPRPGMDYICCP